MIRAALIAATLAVAAPAAADNTCQKAEQLSMTIARNIDKAGTLAVDLIIQCTFHGADDKAVDKLAAASKRAFSTTGSGPDAAASCVKSGELGATFRLIGRASGERIGLAWSLCSTKARARIAELTQKGTKQADMETEIGNMASAWMDTILK